MLIIYEEIKNFHFIGKFLLSKIDMRGFLLRIYNISDYNIK